MNKKLVLVDGHSIIYRCYFAIPMLSNKENTPTNAIYGFVNILLKIIENEKPEYLCIAFDSKEKTFRKVQYEDYKSHRKPMPDELVVQIPLIKEILRAMNISIIEKEGYEADDIIGTISKKASSQNIKVTIYTGDKDSLQLLDNNIIVNIITTKFEKTVEDVYTVENIKEKFGVHHNQIVDYKALVGDQSDNIPGVQGIGPKTAIQLLNQFHTLDNIYTNISLLKESVKNKLINDKNNAYLSKKLATIVTDIDITFDLENFRYNEFNKRDLLEIFTKLEFKSFIERLGLKDNQKILEYEKIDKKLLSDISLISTRSFLSVIYNSILYEFLIYDGNVLWYTNDNMVISNILANCQNQVITYDLKNILHILQYKGPVNKRVFDVMIASYVIDSSRNSYDLNSLILTYLNKNIDPDNNDRYNIYCLLLSDLYKQLKNIIEYNNLQYLFEEVETEIIYVLYFMEYYGIKIDLLELSEYQNEIENSILKLEKDIHLLAGETFNINSPKQLSRILFEKLSLPPIKKTKTGYSTDAEVLEALYEKHEIIKYILDYRMFTKILTTYCNGLRMNIDPKTNRIHTTFIQTGTATGRISSAEPNLQNIPIKYEEGKKIRKIFIPEEGFILIDADYSQIELRVLAHLSQDENLIQAFQKNLDIHTQTAAQIFGVDLNEVTPLMRSQAKAVNFGIIYGISDFGLSRDTNLSVKEASIFIEKYFDRYPKVKQFLDNTVKFAKENGYVTTLLNRRRYIKDINSSNRNVRLANERIAMNSTIQGSAADIIKIAMIKVFKHLNALNLKSRLILQVHDELLVEAYIPEKELVKEIIIKEMQNAYKLLVPLVVECKEGINWYESK